MEVLEAADGQARLRLAPSADLEAVVAECRRSGEILLFAYQPPTLSDLFREAVAA